MTHSRWLLLGCMCGSALLAGGLQACSGDNNNGDAGPDGTMTDAAQDVVQGNDSGPMDSSTGCPTYNGSSGLCKALVSNCNACGSLPGTLNSACGIAHFTQECEGVGSVLSQQFTNAYTSCESACGDAASGCLTAELVDASLSTAQQKFVTDFCNVCKNDAGVCQSNPKPLIAEYNDTIATQIDQACVPDASSGCLGALYCLIGVVQANAPADPCADAGTD